MPISLWSSLHSQEIVRKLWFFCLCFNWHPLVWLTFSKSALKFLYFWHFDGTKALGRSHFVHPHTCCMGSEDNKVEFLSFWTRISPCFVVGETEMQRYIAFLMEHGDGRARLREAALTESQCCPHRGVNIRNFWLSHQWICTSSEWFSGRTQLWGRLKRTGKQVGTPGS